MSGKDWADDIAIAVLDKLTPSGSLVPIVNAMTGNAELDAFTQAFDADEQAWNHLQNTDLVSRLEADFDACIPSISDAMIPLEAWAIPLLSALAGPFAPMLSFGLQVGCKIALAALKAWSAKRKPA